jgi:outer membrane protein OmpA-like peptidoglycan-associated protein
MNMRLSEARANAVRVYLVSKGIAEDRLEAVGYGPTKPIASNKTAKGRAANRRTEFRIVSME